MSHMPGHVAKGAILEKLDNLSRNTTEFPNFYNILKGLKPGNPDLIYVGKFFKLLTDDEAKHLEEHWFEYWWEQHQPVKPVLHLGLLKACQLALAGATPKPLDCYWICAGTCLEVVPCESKELVTVLILTPPPPISGFGATFGPLEKIWVAKHLQMGVAAGEVPDPNYPLTHGVDLVQIKRANGVS